MFENQSKCRIWILVWYFPPIFVCLLIRNNGIEGQITKQLTLRIVIISPSTSFTIFSFIVELADAFPIVIASGSIDCQSKSLKLMIDTVGKRYCNYKSKKKYLFTLCGFSSWFRIEKITLSIPIWKITKMTNSSTKLGFCVFGSVRFFSTSNTFTMIFLNW